MPVDTIVHVESSELEIYRALFDLSQSITGQPDLDTLCEALANSLQRVVSFDSLGLLLYDADTDQLRLYSVNAQRPPRESDIALPAGSDHMTAQVWREQQPVVVSPLDAETRDRELVEAALRRGIHALILVPLSNGDRRLGILAFGFRTPFQPDEPALAFLRRVASEFAVAVDGYLTRRALQKERDRMRVLFDITNSLVSKLPQEELFSAISEQLSRVVAHDFAAIGLQQKDTGDFHLNGLHSPVGLDIQPQEDPIHPEGLPAGEALATGNPVVVVGADFERFPSPIYRRYVEFGFRSTCSIPIIGVTGLRGVLEVARKSEEPFTHDEVDLLIQVARQSCIAIENSMAFKELSRLKDKIATEKLYLEDEIRFDQNIGNMIGESPAFQAVLRSIQIVAPTDATVLIQGETGTGKELVARAIHDLSARSKRSFIKVNCAAIPATLLESELFGHEKGSFTGAFAQKIGRFELAHQGTLFLDEVGEIPVELQSKLLRAIQEQELERLGGSRTIHVDVRFVAATNRNLKQMVDEGKFRSDLYYRLHVFPLLVPPLRERIEDIPLLIRFFTQKHAKRLNRGIESIPSAVFEALSKYDWPGNIRELQNVIERSVILSPGSVLEVPIPDLISSAGPLVRHPHVDEAMERSQILQALRESGGKVAGSDGAAVRLGMRRTTLQSRMKRLHIERQYR